jgi:hypothetical protein
MDGWQDLYVANDLWGSKLFLNLHNGKFRDVTREAGVSDYRGAMGIAIGDWDNDGGPDIFITHWIRQQNTLFGNLRTKLRRQGDTDPVYFADITDTVGLTAISLNYIGWGTSFFDYDNDRQLDIFVVNGSTFQDDKDPRHLVPMKNFLFWQEDPDQGFAEVGAASGAPFQEAHVGRGAAFADYDNDGNVDVFVVNYEGRSMLLRNNGGSKNNWIKVRVKCRKSNRTGFGARIQIQAGGRSQSQEIAGQTSYLSQNFQEAHFGLNREEEVTRLTETYPSGIIQVM